MRERKQDMVKRKNPFIRLAVLAIPLVVLLLLSQTVFAQTTYVINDGSRVLVHTSSVTDPAAVLNEAGLALGADDTYTTQTGIQFYQQGFLIFQRQLGGNIGGHCTFTSTAFAGSYHKNCSHSPSAHKIIIPEIG